MIIGIIKEPDFENRVSLLPEGVRDLKKLKVEVVVEKDAGIRAFAADALYEKEGAKILARDKVLADADVLLMINTPVKDVVASKKAGQVILSVVNPFFNKDVVSELQKNGQTVFSLDLVPRTTRAQSMDILSSMATIAGYKAVLESATLLPHFFPMFMTAAGTIRPAKMLILGAGVAGLQAIATSRKLGAVVEVFDVRSAVKEEVASLGGKFIEVEGAREEKSAGGYAVEQSEDFKNKQKQLIHDHAVKSSVVICTAQIPGRKAPLLVEKATVEAMKPGSVIIDLAASTGGNCAVTENGKTVVHKGVTVVGKSDYPSEMPSDSSKMFGTNLLNFLKLIIDGEGNLNLNFEDDIVKNTCMTHDKQLFNERVKIFMNE